jgi:hypothetical protein
LARGDPGINPLDAACKLHDIAYEETDNKKRLEADRILSKEAWNRVKAKDARLGERTAALAVATAMKVKIGLSKFGGGLKKVSKNVLSKKKKKKNKSKKKKKNSSNANKCTFNGLLKRTKAVMKSVRPKTADQILNCALNAAKRVTSKRNPKIRVPRVIPIPKTGGVLPLVPIFAGLSALGTLAGGTSAIVRAISATKNAKKEFEESQRHNKMMEAIAIGRSKTGDGLYLHPYKRGFGLYLQPYPAQSKN